MPSPDRQRLAPSACHGSAGFGSFLGRWVPGPRLALRLQSDVAMDTRHGTGTGSGVDALVSEVLIYIIIYYIYIYVCIDIYWYIRCMHKYTIYVYIHPCMQIVPCTCLRRTSFVALNCHVRAAVGVRPRKETSTVDIQARKKKPHTQISAYRTDATFM